METKNKKRDFKKDLRPVVVFYGLLFVVWSLFRFLPFEFPEWFEELLIKPVVWVVPVLILVFRVEKKGLASLGFVTQNLRRSIYWGLGLGTIFALEGFLANWLKYGQVNLSSFGYSRGTFLVSLGLSVVAAFTEETVFRGYFFTRLRGILNKDGVAVAVSALLFALIYLPVSVFVLGHQPVVMVVYLGFVFIYGVAAAAVFLLSGNLLASVLLHFLWSWPIFLFR